MRSSGVALARSAFSRHCIALTLTAWTGAASAQVPAVTPPVAPPPLPPPITPSVTSLTLIDARTDRVVAAFDPLLDGAVLEIGALGTDSITVVATTTPPTVSSVQFELDDEILLHDFTAPYSLLGEFRGDLKGWKPTLGTHQLTVTPFLTHGGGRTVGAPHGIQFEVTFEEPHVNAGGTVYVDGAGETWTASAGFSGATAVQHSGSIAGTTDDTLYNAQLEGDAIAFDWCMPPGTYEVVLLFAEQTATAAGQRVFDVLIEGQEVFAGVDVFAAAGAASAYALVWETAVVDGSLHVELKKDAAVVGSLAAMISAIAAHSHDGDEGHPFLHVVIQDPGLLVDYDGDGSEPVALDGSFSHTHEPEHSLVGYSWKDESTHTTLGSGAVLSVPLTVGTHEIELTIADDHIPPATLSDTLEVRVDPIQAVSGALARFYDAAGANLATFIDALPSDADFMAPLTGLSVTAFNGKVGPSPYEGDVVVTLTAAFEASGPATYDFSVTGATHHRVFVDGALTTAPTSLASGAHDLEVRLAVADVSALPAQLMVTIDGGALASFDDIAGVTHDETSIAPFINSMPTTGSALGGDNITISGYGFFPPAAVKVHWGATVLTGIDLAVTPQQINLTSPAGSGTVTVRVETPNGLSNAASFEYDATAVPVSFVAAPGKQLNLLAGITHAAWGPDGRLYMAEKGGRVFAYRFDDNYNEIPPRQTIWTLSSLPNHDITGIAFNPLDPPSPIRIYVSHGQHYANKFDPCTVDSNNDGNADTVNAFSPYSGQISMLEGPNFNTYTPLVTGLPVSNHDHAPNGIAFDNSGNLLVVVGGNTNAGVTGCEIGGIPESPYTSAVLACELWRPNFNGAISYFETLTGQPNNDQTAGHLVDAVPGVHIQTRMTGLRNPFDLVFTTRGRVYVTDNGADNGFGDRSLSATQAGNDPNEEDEFMRVVEGAYHGHPNRNRGRYDDRENVYHAPGESSVPGEWTSPQLILTSSVNGVAEYRATTFNGALRGKVLAQRWNGTTHAIDLSDDGYDATAQALFNDQPALEVLTGPGGVVLNIDYTGKILRVLEPVDVTATGSTAFDIYPWRALPDGLQPFVIGGVHFQGDASVTIGGLPATIQSVSPTRIRGLIPARPDATGELLDVVVTTGGVTNVLEKAFRYVHPRGQGRGVWESLGAAPTSVSGAAAGSIRGVVYVVGGGTSDTLAYDAASGDWLPGLAPTRPDVGDHHAAVVVDHKLYLLGGLNGSAGNRLQIFDPTAATPWSHGADLPFTTGAAGAIALDGLIYLFGGVVNGAPSDLAAVYDPVADSWTTLPPMPAPRSHMSVGTDGETIFAFGGFAPPAPGSQIAVPAADAMTFDPGTSTWQASFQPGSTLAPIPQPTVDAGPSVFWSGELYVIGGATGDGTTAPVETALAWAFDPSTQTWRAEADMLTARAGGALLVRDGGFLSIGGESAGLATAIVEFFQR